VSTTTNRSTDRAAGMSSGAGTVVFVGAGPGDPGLLTMRAAEVLAAADVVLLEHEAQRAVLALASVTGDVQVLDAPEDASALSTAARAKAVVQAAADGRLVARLLAGDPFSEPCAVAEAQACVRAGVGVEVVPGVPLASGVAAYAGIAVGAGPTCGLVDLRAAGAASAALPEPSCQTVILLAKDAAAAATAASRLHDGGWAGDTPVVAVTRGSTLQQRSVHASLGDIATGAVSLPEEDAVSPGAAPLVVVVGRPVADEVPWFESKPLFGWRVLVPRTKEQAAELSARLLHFGAVGEEVPTISVEPPRNPRQMEKALHGIVEGAYEWVAFTSVNALRAVREGLEAHGLDARALSGLKVAAVGERTADALRAWGVEPDLVPTAEQSSAGLVAVWPEYDEEMDPINRVLLPRADIATETLAAGLVALGWEVDDVTAYRTVRAAPPPAPIREAIKAGGFDAVVFTSSSTIRNLVGIAGKPHASTVVACIGPQTAKTAEEYGLRVDVLAPTPSVLALVDALAEFGARRRDEQLAAGGPVSKPSDRRRAPARRPGQQAT